MAILDIGLMPGEEKIRERMQRPISELEGYEGYNTKNAGEIKTLPENENFQILSLPEGAQPGETQLPQTESMRETGLRHAVRTGIKFGTSLATKPQALLDLPIRAGNLAYKGITGEESPVPGNLLTWAFNMPSGQDVTKGLSAVLPKDYLKTKPGSFAEKSDAVADAMAWFMGGPKEGGPAFLTRLGRASLKSSAAVGLGEGGASVGKTLGGQIGEKVNEKRGVEEAEKGKRRGENRGEVIGGLLGYMLGASATSPMGSDELANQTKKQVFNKVKKTIVDDDIKTPPAGPGSPPAVSNRLNQIQNEINGEIALSKEAPWINEVNTALEEVDRIFQEPSREVTMPGGATLQEGKLTKGGEQIKTAPSPLVNQQGQPYATTERLAYKPTSVNQYIDATEKLNDLIFNGGYSPKAVKYLRDIRNTYRDAVNTSLEKHPEVLKDWQYGKDIHAAQETARRIQEFTEKNTPYDRMKTSWLRELITKPNGLASVGAGYLLSKFTPLSLFYGAGIGAAGYGVVRSGLNFSRFLRFAKANKAAEGIVKQAILKGVEGDAQGYAKLVLQLDNMASKWRP